MKFRRREPFLHRYRVSINGNNDYTYQSLNTVISVFQLRENTSRDLRCRVNDVRYSSCNGTGNENEWDFLQNAYSYCDKFQIAEWGWYNEWKWNDFLCVENITRLRRTNVFAFSSTFSGTLGSWSQQTSERGTPNIASAMSSIWPSRTCWEQC